MKKEWYQQKVYYYNSSLDSEQVLCTYWIDEDGKVDEYNLPSKQECATLLAILPYREILVESTGNITEDE